MAQPALHTSIGQIKVQPQGFVVVGQGGVNLIRGNFVGLISLHFPCKYDAVSWDQQRIYECVEWNKGHTKIDSEIELSSDERSLLNYCYEDITSLI